MLSDIDARSDASWSLVDDARSDASWDFAELAQPRSPRCALLAAAEPEAAADTPRDRQPSRRPHHVEPAPGAIFELICERRWASAVRLIELAPRPHEVAEELDIDSNTPLAWAAYKARGADMSCLKLICRLLALNPASAQKRAKNKFLPLHEAAWGNANWAVAVLLAAAHPAALDDKGPRETPHEVGRYYHHGSRMGQPAFCWPPPEAMLQMAVDVRQVADWEKTLANLQLLPSLELHHMASQELQQALDLPEALAKLVVDFATERRAGWLPTIEEDTCRCYSDLAEVARPIGRRARPPTLRSAAARRQRRQRWPRKCEPQKESAEEDLAPPAVRDDVTDLRLLRAKNQGRFAGARRARGDRCSCKQSTLVQDGAGAVHFMTLHAVFPLSRVSLSTQTRRLDSKWPSKAGWRRLRYADRAEKVFDRTL